VSLLQLAWSGSYAYTSTHELASHFRQLQRCSFDTIAVDDGYVFD